MIRLLALGGLTIASSRAHGLAVRPGLQGLVLLARLAVAGSRGLSRDKLVGCFWPERDERHARHSLSQTLHRLRRELHSRLLILGTSMVSLNPDCITSDVAEFEESVKTRNVARAAELYTGPFLDGVFLSGAPDVDRWVEAERRRFAELHARCIRQLAREAAERREHRAAASLWRRLTLADPLDGDAALALAESLDAAGDRTTALREMNAHEAAVRAELGEKLDPALQRFVDRVRIAPVVADPEPSANELCARARQLIHGFTKAGYAEAVRLLEHALSLDPVNPAPHIALASLNILLSQATQEGNPRASAVAHCRRAIEIDPTLAEPHLWLACASMLDERFAEAEAHVERGLALDPDVYFSNHLVGWVYMADALKTGSASAMQRTCETFRRAVAVLPDEQGLLTSIGGLYTFDGQYGVAESVFERALDSERRPAGVRMIGARTLLGAVQLRQGKWAVAEANLERALAEYSDAPQMFAPYVNALTLCALGDARRRAGRYDDAVAFYVRARALIEPHPQLIGVGYLIVRLQTRLAAVYHHLWMRGDEMRSAQEALELTRTRRHYSFNWCWLVSEGSLHYDWAVYHATCGDRQAMVASIERALALSWRETARIDLEPAFTGYHSDEGFRRQLEAAAARTPLPPIILDAAAV